MQKVTPRAFTTRKMPLIHFFDIDSKAPVPDKCWSPNTLKIRLTLNYRHIPYTQSYVSLPDIKPLLSSLGLAPQPNKPRNGYTLPAIFLPGSFSSGPNTTVGSGGKEDGRVMMESLDIALHLENLYPDAPSMFPTIPGVSTREETLQLAKSVQRMIVATFKAGCIGKLITPRMPDILDDKSRAAYMKNHDPFPTVAASKEENEADWQLYETTMEPVAQVLRSHDQGPFCLGDTFSYADTIIVGQLVWFARVDPQGFEKRIKQMHDGVFGRLYDRVKTEGWIDGQGEDRPWPIPSQSASL